MTIIILNRDYRAIFIMKEFTTIESTFLNNIEIKMMVYY